MNELLGQGMIFAFLMYQSMDTSHLVIVKGGFLLYLVVVGRAPKAVLKAYKLVLRVN